MVDPSPNDHAAFEPFNDVSSEAETDEVEELEAMGDSERSSICTWFSREGADGAGHASFGVKCDKEGIDPVRPSRWTSLCTNVAVDDAEIAEVRAWRIGENVHCSKGTQN